MKKWQLLLLITVLILQFLDIATTSEALKLGAKELSPLISYLWNNLGFYSAVLVKFLIYGLSLLALFYISNNSKKDFVVRACDFTSFFLLGISLFVVLINSVNLLILTFI